MMMSQELPKTVKTLKILVVDDHPVVLGGTLDLLVEEYPTAEMLTARTAKETGKQVAKEQPDLVVMDLSIPEVAGETAEIGVGIQCVRTLMGSYPDLSFTIQSSHIKALVRIKHEIDAHQGGFTIADKGLSGREMLARVDWALQGVTHTKDIQTSLEIKPEWYDVLQLAFKEGLQDKAIAKQMNVAERTVRHYWTKIYDVLGIYPEDGKKSGKNTRIQTEIKAREVGLID